MAHSVLTEALQHVPALLLIVGTVYVAYWLLGIVKFPRSATRDRWLRTWCIVEPEALDRSRWSSLALISFISLFMELLLIRWVASEIRIFAYFKSLVLIACFLGFGLGCYLTGQTISLFYTLMPLLVVVWLVELPWAPLRHLMFNLSGFIGWFSGVHIWSRAYFAGNPLWGIVSASAALVIVISLFGLIAVSFVPLGQLVGWYLENAKHGISAYSLNVVASILGIWVYTILCFFSTQPWLWFAFLSCGLLAFFWRFRRLKRVMIPCLGAMLLLFAIGKSKMRWWGEDSWKGSTLAI